MARMPASSCSHRRITAAHPERPRVVVLTTFGSDAYVLDAVRAGASAFLLKEAPPEQVLAAVHAVAAGDAVLDPGVTRALLEHVATAPAPRADTAGRLAALTPREREVLEALARGLSNAEIARELLMGEGTVKTHVARVLAKTGARDRAQAVIFAYQTGVAR